MTYNICQKYQRQGMCKRIYQIFKFIFDEVIAVVLIVVLLPLFLIISILIKGEDGGKVIYIQKRVGKNGKDLRMYKFRSMKENADKLENYLTPEELEEYRVNYKLDNDRRVTKIGKFLRKSSIDELPQLFNVLKGEMSLIGPRPILEDETKLYGINRDKLLSVKPGMTGYWQAYARNEVGYEDNKRQEMELYYIDNQSLGLDIKILFKTIDIVISGRGAK